MASMDVSEGFSSDEREAYLYNFEENFDEDYDAWLDRVDSMDKFVKSIDATIVW
jgi:hypothetical protein